jgi:hypothetical protein
MPNEQSGGLLVRDEIAFKGGLRQPPAAAVEPASYLGEPSCGRGFGCARSAAASCCTAGGDDGLRTLSTTRCLCSKDRVS